MIQALIPLVLRMLAGGAAAEGAAAGAGAEVSLSGLAAQTGRQAVLDQLANSAAKQQSQKQAPRSLWQTMGNAGRSSLWNVMGQRPTPPPQFAAWPQAQSATNNSGTPSGKMGPAGGFMAGSMMTTLMHSLSQVDPNHAELVRQLSDAHFNRAQTQGLMQGMPSNGIHQVFPGTSNKFSEAKEETGLLGKAFSLLLKPLKMATDQFTMLPRVLIKLFQGLTEQAEMIVENNRDLSLWNGQLAASFAQLDLTRQQLQIGQASANSGSGSLLNETFGDLLTELQPIRSSLGTVVNIGGIIAAHLAKGLVLLAQWNPLIGAGMRALAEIEKKMQDAAAKNDDPMKQDLRALIDARPAGDNRLGQRPLQPIGPRAPLPPMLDPLPNRQRRRR